MVCTKQSDLLRIAKIRGIKHLSERVEIEIPELIDSAKSCLEAVGVIDAEKHSISEANAKKLFEAADEFWKNENFARLHSKSILAVNFDLLETTQRFSSRTSFSIQSQRFDFIREDTSLEYFLRAASTSVSIGMRVAISILIRYWCMEFMLEEYLDKDIGLYALGLDISFDTAAVAVAVDQKTPLNSGGEEELFVGHPEKRFSPICHLVNVWSIQRLALDIEQNSELQALAQELLKTLDPTKNVGSEPPFIQHCEAMWEIWRNEDFRMLMRKRLLNDPPLLVMMKMFSDQFKREITMDRLQRICSPLYKSFFKKNVFNVFDLEKPEEKIRCAFTILLRFWACVGEMRRVRANFGFGYSPCPGGRKPRVLYAAEKKDELLVEVLFYPEQNDDPAHRDLGLTHWCEANQTQINHLLDKEWRDVLTRRYSTKEEEIESLLGKIGLDKHMKLVLKKGSGDNLCMTC